MFRSVRVSCLSVFLVSLALGGFWGSACSSPNTQEEPNVEKSTTDAGGNTEQVAQDAGQSDQDTTKDEATPEVAKEQAPDTAWKSPYTFKGEKVTCQRNSSFEKLKVILQGGKNNPTGRGEQAGAFDPCNQRVILFGGNDFQPKQCADFGPKRFKGDTWTYVLAYKNWVRLKTGTSPKARGRHTTVFDRSRKKIYLFGGRFRPEGASGSYQLFNDLWSFDVNTDTWTEIQAKGSTPSPRSNSYMVYDANNDQVILFGGNVSTSGLRFIPLNDTYILSLDTMTWTKVQTATAPKARLFHTMMVDHKRNRVIVYGGGGANAFTGPFYGDVWSFDIKTRTWKQIWIRTLLTPGPPARIETMLLEDKERDRMLMFAGHDDTAIGHRNDIWSFDLKTNKWKVVNKGDTGTGSGCSSFCRCNPDFVTVDKNSPERRQYHSFHHILGSNQAVLFGGKTDCGYIDDTWTFDLSTDKWTEVNAASQGEACKRTGRQDCKELCY